MIELVIVTGFFVGAFAAVVGVCYVMCKGVNKLLYWIYGIKEQEE